MISPDVPAWNFPVITPNRTRRDSILFSFFCCCHLAKQKHRKNDNALPLIVSWSLRTLNLPLRNGNIWWSTWKLVLQKSSEQLEIVRHIEIFLCHTSNFQNSLYICIIFSFFAKNGIEIFISMFSKNICQSCFYIGAFHPPPFFLVHYVFYLFPEKQYN